MLRTIKSLILILALTGCATTPWTDTHQNALHQDALQQDALRQEAGYLAGLLKTNKITKVQAADRLDIRRIELVGQNLYDDEVFAYYRHLAGERDRKRIDQAEAQSLMRKKLAEVRARYRQDPGKPGKTPVFTNFLMELYGLPPL